MSTTHYTVQARDLVLGVTRVMVNGTATTITESVPGPVWLNEEHTHLMCAPGNLFLTTEAGFRFPVTPSTKLVMAPAASGWTDADDTEFQPRRNNTVTPS